MPPLTYIHALETARTTVGGIVGNAIPADAPTRSLSKRCNAGAVTLGNAGAVTLGSVTHYRVVGGSKITHPYRL